MDTSAVTAKHNFPFELGKIVKIINTLWCNFRDRIVRIDNANRIAVEGHVFVRMCKLTLPADEIEAV